MNITNFNGFISPSHDFSITYIGYKQTIESKEEKKKTDQLMLVILPIVIKYLLFVFHKCHNKLLRLFEQKINEKKELNITVITKKKLHSIRIGKNNY